MDAAIAAKADIPRASSRERKTRVFLSYSRKDSAFSNRLVDALNARGFEAYLDKKDILPGEPWERLDALILSADAIGFVISPDSIASKVCAWEVERTESLQKKLLPLVHRPVADADVPPRLARLNYIFLREEDDFDAALSTLAVALETDIAWIRQHTHIGELAQRWDSAGRPTVGGRLLRGEELTDAETWLLTSPKGAPDPTEVQRAYVQASRGFETSEIEKERAQIARTRRFQKRSAWALGGVGLLVLAMTANVILQQRDTDRREATVFLNPVDKAMEEERYDRAMRYALQALPARGAAPWSPVSSALEAKLGGAALMSRLQRTLPIATGFRRVMAVLSPDGKRVAVQGGDSSIRVLDAASGTTVVTLADSAVKGVLWHLTFSPDGERIAVASSHDVRVWEAATGKPVAALTGHKGNVTSVAFSPDGRRVVTTSSGNANDLTARVWDAATGQPVAVLKGHTKGLESAAFNPDGSRVVTASDDTTARIWDAHSGRQLGVLVGHREPVAHASFSPDGRLVLTASKDANGAAKEHTARLWDAESGNEVVVLRGHTGGIYSAAFSPDGAIILTAAADNTARLWDAASGKEMAIAEGHSAYLTSAAFSPDGKLIVTGSADDTARLWDARTGEAIATLSGHESTVLSAAFSAGGRRILTVAEDATARIWDVPEAMLTMRGHDAVVSAAAYSPDGRLIATAGEDKTVRLWEAATGKAGMVLTGHDGAVSSVAFSPDGTRLVSTSEDKTARVWDVAGGAAAIVLTGHTDTVTSAQFNPDGQWIATAGADHTVRLWQTATGNEVRLFRGHTDAVQRVAFSPDGRSIVTAASDTTARLWDVASGTELATITGHSADRGLTGAMFSPDGRRLITTGGDNTAILWGVATRQQITGFEHHARGLRGATFTRDGARVLLPGGRGVNISDAASGMSAAILQVGRSVVPDAAFSPDGSRVVTASEDTIARVWDVSLATILRGSALRERVCSEKLAGAQRFTDAELDDPILAGIDREDPVARNPCLRRGPLSLGYYRQSIAKLWRWASTAWR